MWLFWRDIAWFLIGFATPMEWMINGDWRWFFPTKKSICLFDWQTNIPGLVDRKLRHLTYGKVSLKLLQLHIENPWFFFLGQRVWHVWLSSLNSKGPSGNSACPVLWFSMHIFCDHWWASNWHIIRPGWKKSQNVSRLFWSRDVNLSTFVCLKLVFFRWKKG